MWWFGLFVAGIGRQGRNASVSLVGRLIENGNLEDREGDGKIT
jgi:hypothetical protein